MTINHTPAASLTSAQSSLRRFAASALIATAAGAAVVGAAIGTLALNAPTAHAETQSWANGNCPVYAATAVYSSYRTGNDKNEQCYQLKANGQVEGSWTQTLYGYYVPIDRAIENANAHGLPDKVSVPATTPIPTPQQHQEVPAHR